MFKSRQFFIDKFENLLIKLVQEKMQHQHHRYTAARNSRNRKSHQRLVIIIQKRQKRLFWIIHQNTHLALKLKLKKLVVHLVSIFHIYILQ